MKKQAKKALVVLTGVLVCFLIVTMAACDSGKDMPDNNESNVYSVTFIAGGEVYIVTDSKEDGTVKLPADPTTDEGYEFTGWYLDDGVWQEPFTAETKVSQDTKVYARIEKIPAVTYEVTFIAGEEVYIVTDSKEDGTVKLPADPATDEGYEFTGWYLDDGVWQEPFTTETLAGIPVTSDVAVYAKIYKHVLAPTSGGTIETLNIGSRVWSTNDYVFTSLPQVFLGKPYILWTINGPNTAKAISSGWLYVITGEVLDFGTASSQMVVLDEQNFTLLDTSYWNIWDAGLKNNVIYEKYVEPGETFTLGRWSVVIMSDEQLNVKEGEPLPTDEEMAVLLPAAGDNVVNMALKAVVFTDRAQYTFYDMPYWLAGKNYIQTAYASSSHSAGIAKSGLVYMLTSKAGNISQVQSLVDKGWEDVTATIDPDLNLFGDSSQNGGFMSNTYKGFALLKKYCQEGETITWGQWGIPVFSGELVLSDDIATLAVASDTTFAAKADDGMRLFTNRTYYAMDGLPEALKGLTYFMDTIENGATVRAITSGTAYIMVPTGSNVYKSLETQVKAEGWQLVPFRYFRPAVGLLFMGKMYYKHVEPGEEIHYGKYNLVFGAPMDEEDYYVMPSLTTPADIIIHPEGERYDTNKQNWLGCPTIERTEGGRLWSGWFTGGEKELGTGNYAIICLSDDDGKSWKKELAVVHPDTAVQVTKPELWMAPGGELWLIWIQHTGTGNFDGRMGTWASVCKNPDATEPVWTAPRRLSDGYMRSKPIIVDVNGVETWMYAAFDWMQPHYTRVYASTDKGANWSLRGKSECIDRSSGKNNLDDPVLAQKPDGTLWLLTRPSSGNNVMESFSYDGGYTWTHAVKSDIIGPQSRLTVNLLSDGKMLMVFHDGTSRANLTAFLSLDGGQTWQYKLLLDERGGVSYPDTIITPDGKIYVIYDRNRTTDREIWLSVFTLDDIVAGKFITEASRSKILVDKAWTA